MEVSREAARGQKRKKMMAGQECRTHRWVGELEDSAHAPGTGCQGEDALAALLLKGAQGVREGGSGHGSPGGAGPHTLLLLPGPPQRSGYFYRVLHCMQASGIDNTIIAKKKSGMNRRKKNLPEKHVFKHL